MSSFEMLFHSGFEDGAMSIIFITRNKQRLIMNITSIYYAYIHPKFIVQNYYTTFIYLYQLHQIWLSVKVKVRGLLSWNLNSSQSLFGENYINIIDIMPLILTANFTDELIYKFVIYCNVHIKFPTQPSTLAPHINNPT